MSGHPTEPPGPQDDPAKAGEAGGFGGFGGGSAWVPPMPSVPPAPSDPPADDRDAPGQASSWGSPGAADDPDAHRPSAAESAAAPDGAAQAASGGTPESDTGPEAVREARRRRLDAVRRRLSGADTSAAHTAYAATSGPDDGRESPGSGSAPQAAPVPAGSRAARRRAHRAGANSRSTTPNSPGFRPFGRLAPLVAGRRTEGARATAARLIVRVSVDYPRAGRTGARRWLPSWRQVMGAGLAGAFGLTVLLVIGYVMTDIPTNLNSFAIQQDNVYYWADGTEMARTGQIDRQAVPLSQVPEKVQWAVLAAENETFYSDGGISPSGMVRAVYEMIKGQDTQGGSTITQQYVKNAYLNQQQTLSRKIAEVFIAIKLDNRMSKQQILDAYLNTSWFGRGTYGIERAAKAYYGKDVSQLNASQGAFLASLLKGAGYYDPALGSANRQRAVTRWNWILDRMVAIGRLSPQERASYKTFPEPIDPPRPPGLSGQVGYLQETAKAYVLAHSDISDEAFDLGGYQVYTTFRKSDVKALAASVKQTLSGLRPTARAADQHVRVGAATVDTGGRMVALYGGPDYVKQGFNDSNTTTIQAGTAFTPFVYAAALSEGVQTGRGGPRAPVTPRTVYNGDNKVPLMTPEGPYWDRNGRIVKGVNDGGRSFGPVTLADALAQSANSPFLQLGMDVGLDRVRIASQRAGLLPSSMGEQVPAFSLGDSTPSAIRMADAYATFDAGGMHAEPYSVQRVVHYGSTVAIRNPAAVRAFSAQVAADVDDALVKAVRNGTGHAAAAVPGRVAGKDGTAQDDKAAWFAGYSGPLSTAVVVFRLDPKSQEPLPLTGMGGTPASQTGSSYPVQIWTRYMASAVRR